MATKSFRFDLFMIQSFRKQLSPAQYTSLALLILGVVIAVWMVKRSSALTQRDSQLENLHRRIGYDIAVASESLLRSLEFDPKTKDEKRRAAVDDLDDAIVELQKAFDDD